MRIAFLGLCVSLGVALSACSSRADANHKRSYYDAILASESKYCDPGQGDQGTAQAATVDANLDQGFKALAKLTAPAGLEAQHRSLVDSFGELTTAVAQAKAHTPTPSDVERSVELRDAAGTAESDWLDAFRTEYGIGLWTMEGSSMLPAYHNGEIFAIPRYADQRIDRFQTIVFEFPLDPSRHFIKRVIGLPGETVEVRSGEILIDGERLDDKYEQSAPNYVYGPKTVPAGQYWVLGDNVNNSYDSHAWQQQCTPQQECDFVPKSMILGVLPVDATPVARESCPVTTAG